MITFFRHGGILDVADDVTALKKNHPTEYGRKVFDQKILADMKSIFERITNEHPVTLEEFNGEEDHVHLLIHYPPKVSLVKLVNSLKGVSSRRLRQNWPELEKKYHQGVLWSPSYFAGSCGGAPIDIIRKYIKAQKTPHETLLGKRAYYRLHE